MTHDNGTIELFIFSLLSGLNRISKFLQRKETSYCFSTVAGKQEKKRNKSVAGYNNFHGMSKLHSSLYVIQTIRQQLNLQMDMDETRLLAGHCSGCCDLVLASFCNRDHFLHHSFFLSLLFKAFNIKFENVDGKWSCGICTSQHSLNAFPG